MQVIMEAKCYKVPSAAYPRYDYSVREGISIYKRYNVILKDIGFGDKCDTITLEYFEEPQIVVACENSTIKTVGIADIELNKLNAVHEVEKKTYSDFETLIDDSNINSEIPKIVVVELKQTYRNVSDYAKWKNNVIIVVNDKDFISSTTDDVRMTNKDNLGTEICLMLERIAFRKMLPLIAILRGLLALADCKNLTKVVGKRMSDCIRTILREENMLIGWMNDTEHSKISVTEEDPRTERHFEQYLHKDISNEDRINFRDCINTEYIVQYEEGRQAKRNGEDTLDEADDDVPIPTTSTDGKGSIKTTDEKVIKKQTANTSANDEEKIKHKQEYNTVQVVEYFEENALMYELVGKLAEHVAHILEQEVITEYKKLPKQFKKLLNIEIVIKDIRDEVAAELFKLFVCTIDSKLEEDDRAEEMVLVKLRYRTRVILRGIRNIVAQLKFIDAIDHHIKLIKVESDRAINRLLGDLNGLFRRSKIPDSERPKSAEFKRLNDKVAHKLLEDVKEAKGCGYRYDKLHVFVEEIIDPDTKETVKSDIKKILLGYNISDYIVSSNTTAVQHFKQVGAKIHATRSGTLGGFALMGKQEHLCALLSKHVADGATEIRYKASSDDEIVIGSMIQANVSQEQHVDQANSNDEIVIGSMIQADVSQEQHGSQATPSVVPFADRVDDAVDSDVVIDFVDVTAAKILDSVKSDCDTHFKDSLWHSMNSKICHFTDSEIKDLVGLKVHICGASTKLGTGTITIPEFHVKGNQKLVVVEDIENVDGKIVRFSREGDSGAVICADHPDGNYVQVISMLVGCNNYEKISEKDPHNEKNKGEYLSFRMIHGLECLKRETKQEFKLCNAY